MKKIIAALSLLILMGCAGTNYRVTEGPLRGKFARPFSIQYVNQPWNMPIFLNGELPQHPVHVEGYLINNGTEYYQYHADLPELRARLFEVQNRFTTNQYCEAVGRPLDRFNADEEFMNRHNNPGDPTEKYAPIPQTAATGVVLVVFKFHEFSQDSTGKWKHGKLLMTVKTEVQLECPQCQCGSKLI
jgi:hypothetical protein